MEERQKVTSAQPSKGMITEMHEDLVPGEYWTHARNATLNSHLGQSNLLQSEPAPKFCVELPYTMVGYIKLLDSRFAVFTTDNTDSEIGVFDSKNCSYTKLVNDKCLNFHTTALVEGHSRKAADCGEVIYWTDKRNPRRFLKLEAIPYQYTIEDDECKSKKFTNKLDCDALLMESKINVPVIKTRRGTGGDLTNGVYSFALAYAFEKQRVTDYYSITPPQSIFTHENYGQSIDLDITGLDRDFDAYELIVLYTRNNVNYQKTLGFYSTAQDKVHVSSVDRPENTALVLEEIVVKRPKYPYADGVEANDQYLLWHGVRSAGELNYQLQAMQIKSKYVVYQAPADYYQKGGTLVGYMRDEVYAFGIQWLMENGEWSPAYHIPGDATPTGRLASGRDVYENYLKDTGITSTVEVGPWLTSNNADVMRPLNANSNAQEKIVGEGKMSYWESVYKLPDNEVMFGDKKCTPILHHKFPDNCKTHIYSQGGKFINILGIKFENIEHPIDSNNQPVKGIKGYRIVRSDRRGNKSIVAKGVFTNVRSYNEENGQAVLYANYPFNDLRQDNFLSNKQPYFKNGEKDFRALTEFKTDQFNFYSPETSFRHISLGDEVYFYTEEYANVVGFFEEVYKHPKHKLLTQFDLYFALVIGALDGYYAMQGKRCITTVGKQEISLGLGAGVVNTPSGPSLPTTIPIPGQVAQNTQVQACDDALNFTTALTANPRQIRGIERVLRTLAKAGVFAFFALKTANTVLEIIANASPWRQYALQYNSHGLFNEFVCIQDGNRRRFLNHYQYIFDGNNTVEGNIFNNYKREDSVYVRVNESVAVPSKIDNTRGRLEDFGLCKDPFKKTKSTASLYYGAIKKKRPDQYGQLDSITYLDTGYLVTELPLSEDKVPIYTAEAVFGGDVYINKTSVKRSHHYFSQFLKEGPDGFIDNYSLHRNVAYPRYWADFTPYDMSNFVIPRPKMSNTPRQKHNLSCQGSNSLNGVSVVADRYFYLFNSGVIEYFCESTMNLAMRDWKKEEANFYGQHNQDLSRLFRSDKIEEREEYVYDMTYSKQLEENSILQQRLDYDPALDKTCYQYHKNRVIYSLPDMGAKNDNWLVYLTNNMYEFPQTEFGDLTTIHAIDNQQFMFLFDKSAPYVTIGRDELQLDGSGKKITVGDGGLFARDPRPLAYTDYGYGNCQNKWAFVNTQFGSFYPSQRQGRLFKGQGLEDIARLGMHFWFKGYMPSQLQQAFPEFPYPDNPVLGTGMLSSFDNDNETYYLTKRDWAVRKEYKGKLTYNQTDGKFHSPALKFDLGDPEVFQDASWTISFSPRINGFVSYHDWHPDWMIQGEKHFMSVKHNAIWKHNENYELFCNAYGVDVPFEVELNFNNSGEIDVLRSIEYHMQVGKYFNEGRDFHHILDENFDYAIVHNSEQMSGRLKMILQSKKDMSQLFGYPRNDVANDQIFVLYNKEEHRYRLNMFEDIVKDRGEFSHNNYPLWISNPNGYVKEVNQSAISYSKPVQHRKKFRHRVNKVKFIKDKCGDKKFIFNFALAKQTRSER